MNKKKIVTILIILIVTISLLVIGLGVHAVVTKEFNFWNSILLGFDVLLVTTVLIIKNGNNEK